MVGKAYYHQQNPSDPEFASRATLIKWVYEYDFVNDYSKLPAVQVKSKLLGFREAFQFMKLHKIILRYFHYESNRPSWTSRPASPPSARGRSPRRGTSIEEGGRSGCVVWGMDDPPCLCTVRIETWRGGRSGEMERRRRRRAGNAGRLFWEAEACCILYLCTVSSQAILRQN